MIRARRVGAVLVLSSLTMLGCSNSQPSDSSIDREAARSLSDSVMADLVNDRVDLAMDKIEPELLAALGRPRAEGALRTLFSYCGRPLDREFERDESGYFVAFADGRRRSQRTFKYAPTTTTSPKGVCIWTVNVVQTNNGLRVASLKAGRRVSTEPFTAASPPASDPDAVMATLNAYRRRTITADSAAKVLVDQIEGGRSVNVQLDTALEAALRREMDRRRSQ